MKPKSAMPKPPTNETGKLFTPGQGLPPVNEGIYWVHEPGMGRRLAFCDGKAPFIQVRLYDPWEQGRPPWVPALAVVETLQWLGVIAVPPVPPIRDTGKEVAKT